MLVSDAEALREAAAAVDWKAGRRVKVRVLGQLAQISVWRKPAWQDRMEGN